MKHALPLFTLGISIIVASLLSYGTTYSPQIIIIGLLIISAVFYIIFRYFIYFIFSKYNYSRISLVNLRNYCSKKGLDVTGQQNLQVMDLLDALRQLAIDGDVKIWGRRDDFGLAGDYDFSIIQNEPLVPIPSSHFEKYDFHVGGFVEQDDNNRNMTLKSGDNPTKGGYADIHPEAENLKKLLKLLERRSGFRDYRHKT